MYCILYNSTPIHHSFVRNIFLIIYYTTCLKLKILLDHFGSQNNFQNIPVKCDLFYWKIDRTDKYQAHFFCFLCVLSLSLFYIEKIISIFQMSISWSKERWRSFICIPSVKDTSIFFWKCSTLCYCSLQCSVGIWRSLQPSPSLSPSPLDHQQIIPHTGDKASLDQCG